MTPTTGTSGTAAATTPLHDKVWIGSRLDDDRGKLYRAECACGLLDGPWHDDHAQALADARSHRDHNALGPTR